jgi:hypothetical protein
MELHGGSGDDFHDRYRRFAQWQCISFAVCSTLHVRERKDRAQHACGVLVTHCVKSAKGDGKIAWDFVFDCAIRPSAKIDEHKYIGHNSKPGPTDQPACGERSGPCITKMYRFSSPVSNTKLLAPDSHCLQSRPETSAPVRNARYSAKASSNGWKQQAHHHPGLVRLTKSQHTGNVCTTCRG